MEDKKNDKNAKPAGTRQRVERSDTDKLAYYNQLIKRTVELRDALALKMAIAKDPALQKRIQELTGQK